MELHASDIIQLSNDIKKGCTATINHTKNYMIHFKDKLQDFNCELDKLIQDQKEKGAMIGILGDMGSGKTTLTNALIGVPLFPVAGITTSVCPVEFHYAQKPSFTVFTYERTMDGTNFQCKETPVYTFNENVHLTEVQKRALIQFASDCIKYGVLYCENLTYYYSLNSIADGSFEVDWNNMMQVFQLLAILLAGHVGQDDVDRNSEKDKLVAKRAELLKSIIGLNDDADYGIRIGMSSDLLDNGLVLVDLPGLGSNVGKHDGITTDYLFRTDSIVLVYGDDANTKETNAALKRVMKSEKMQTEGKDSRFLAVLNKCDDPYEKDPDAYSIRLSQAVQSIKPQCKEVKIREIIPISALYAEYRYLKNGIDLKMTRLWSKGYKRRAEREGISADLYENAKKELDERYHTEFEYTDTETQKTVKYSTAFFMEETIGQYTARIRFLNAIKQFDDLVGKYNGQLTKLQMEAAFLRLIQLCGDRFMRSLLDEMNRAFQSVEAKFVSELDAAQADIAAQQTRLAFQVNEASHAYLKGLDSADKAMNRYMGDIIKTMESDWRGHVCIDCKDDMSERNKGKFDSLCSYMEKFDFGSYLDPGDKLLQNQMDLQRNTYSGNKQKFKNCFANLRADMHYSLEQTYDVFVGNISSQSEEMGITLSEDDLQLYKRCYQGALDAVLRYMDTLTAQMCQEIDCDNRINDEIGKTVKNIQAFFIDYETRIHLRAKNYIDIACKESTIFKKRPHLNTGKICSELSRPFSGEAERQQYLSQLPAVLCDQSKNSHSSRMMNMSKDVFVSFRMNASNKMTQFFPSIKATVTNYFGNTAAELAGKYQELKYQADVLFSSIDGMKNSDAWKSAQSYGNTTVWAEKDILACVRHTEKFLEEAKTFSAEMETEDKKSESVYDN